MQAISSFPSLATALLLPNQPKKILAGIISLVGVSLHFSFADCSPGAMVTRGAGSANEAEDASILTYHQPRQAECNALYRQLGLKIVPFSRQCWE